MAAPAPTRHRACCSGAGATTRRSPTSWAVPGTARDSMTLTELRSHRRRRRGRQGRRAKGIQLRRAACCAGSRTAWCAAMPCWLIGLGAVALMVYFLIVGAVVMSGLLAAESAGADVGFPLMPGPGAVAGHRRRCPDRTRSPSVRGRERRKALALIDHVGDDRGARCIYALMVQFETPTSAISSGSQFQFRQRTDPGSSRSASVGWPASTASPCGWSC